jgi:hypothetical protein
VLNRGNYRRDLFAMGASDSISSLLHRFRAAGATSQTEFKAIVSGFRA